MKKDNIKNTVAKTGISINNNKNANGSYNIPITVGITAINPNINKFSLGGIIILFMIFSYNTKTGNFQL